MAHFKYIKLESVIARVYELMTPERVNELSLYRWAADAIKDVYVFETLQDGVCFAEVCNFKAKLPKGYKHIHQILFKENIKCPFTIKIPLHTTTLVDDPTTPGADTPLLDSNQPLMNQPAGITYPSNMLFLGDYKQCCGRMTHHGWLPLYKSTSVFHQAINQGIDITSECGKHTYSFDKGCGTITTSFEKGWVAIAFVGYPECDGSYLIPDFESSVPQAIEKYLLYKIFEKEAIMGVEGSSGQEQKYHREWELLCGKARGNQKLMDKDDLENLKRSLIRLTPHNNTYTSGSGNASDFEYLNFA